MTGVLSTKSRPRNLTCLFRIAVISALLTPGVSRATDLAIGDSGCGTEQVFEARRAERRVTSTTANSPCPGNGMCDDPAIRNLYPSGGRVTVIPLYFQVVCQNDGSNPAATEAEVAAQVDLLNGHFAPYEFRFEYDLRFINSTPYRFLTSFDDAELMKSQYAVDPAGQLNIFVTTNAFCLCSYATYPWDPKALTSQGGIVMTRERFYPQSRTGTSLTHEVGHCLGLWHTQHGVTEVAPCSDCYESQDATDRDRSGDFCADTDPTPSNVTCFPPPGTDQCSGLPWGATDLQNYMGYGPDNCVVEFTLQQVARMHCWVESRFGSMTNISHPADTLFGAAPFSVRMEGRSERQITQWLWDFGDGQTSDVQNPGHIYTRAGVFNIRCAVVSDSGVFQVDSLPQVYVTGDTLVVGSVTADPNTSARVDIRINNRVPLSRLEIPVSWDGPLDLTFDSICTVGLRTSGLTVANGGIAIIDMQPSNRRMTIVVKPDSANLISPGSGRILDLYFHTPPIMASEENPIKIAGYEANQPVLGTIPGNFTPYTVSGALRAGCCVGWTGNVDDDPDDVVDVADVSQMVMSLFVDFRPLPCPREANIDGDPDGTVDIADLTALLDHLYISLKPTAPCR